MSKFEYMKYSSENKIPPEKLEEFHNKVYEMAQEEFGVDETDTPPIQIRLIDRTRYWSEHYRPMKMSHAYRDEDAEIDPKAVDIYFEDEIMKASSNLSMANEVMSRLISIRQYERRDAEERQEKEEVSPND